MFDPVLAWNKPLSGPAVRQSRAHAGALEISVVFTTVRSTIETLKRAGALAQPLNARITLLVPQIVPYPFPLASPPVLLDFNERRVFNLASRSPVETVVRIYLCRDRWEALSKVLACHSLVLLGGRRTWWRAAEARLAKRLRRLGHEVVLFETE